MQTMRQIASISYKAIYPYQTPFKYLLFRVLDPLFHYLFFALIGLAILGKDYLQFIILGNIFFLTARTLITNMILIFRSERLYGTLMLNVASPTKTTRLILIRTIIPALDAFFVAIISLLLAFLLFHFNLNWRLLPLLVLYLLVLIFSLSGLSLILSSFGLVFRNVNLFMNLALSVLQIFCGVNFSVSLLPGGLKYVSQILPITNALSAVRRLYSGASIAEVAPLLFHELLIGAIYLILAVLLVRTLEKTAVAKGSLFVEQ